MAGGGFARKLPSEEEGAAALCFTCNERLAKAMLRDVVTALIAQNDPTQSG